jgi:hypothetical protein
MNRDSQLWWWLMAGAILTALSSRFDALDVLLPAQHTDKAHALIEMASLIVATVSGIMRASPIHDISDEGREKFKAAAERREADRP